MERGLAQGGGSKGAASCRHGDEGAHYCALGERRRSDSLIRSAGERSLPGIEHRSQAPMTAVDVLRRSRAAVDGDVWMTEMRQAPPASPRLLGAGASTVRALHGLLEESVEHRPLMKLAAPHHRADSAYIADVAERIRSEEDKISASASRDHTD